MVTGKALLGAAVVVLAAAAYPAYADDFATSLQQVVDTWVDLRNNHLIKTYFEATYTTPEMAAVETVKAAIDLYDDTRADPQVPITERGSFVRHPINPYGTTVVAFDVINSMGTTKEVYPFVIDVHTMKMLAEGAFPGTVGLAAVFLNDADLPLNEILEDLQESDGVWVSYTFNNPSNQRYDVKHAYLSLYDGYIFGSGYYESPDKRATEGVADMVRAYDASGTDAFAATQTDHGSSFVLDAGTLGVVAHTSPDVTGSAIRDALDTAWPLDTLSEILAKHGSMWVSYPSADPQSDSKYVRAHIQLHDGYVFGSGYGITLEERSQSLASESVELYKMEGDGAFPIITSLKVKLHSVIDPRDKNTVVAVAGRPGLVGQSLGQKLLDQNPRDVGQHIREHGGMWVDNVFVDPRSTAAEEIRRSSWIAGHDRYFFVSGHTYQPERAAIEVVDAAIAAYKSHGEEAFDHITWQSVKPEIIYPFVVDAQTWELVAHAAVPERVGVCCALPIAASNDLDAARQDLEQNPGIWLEYSFYNPISDRYEYKRAWFSTYDGYTFAAGYYYGNFDELESIISEAIGLYDSEGKDAAFASINGMNAVGVNYPLVLDRETFEIVAHGQNPGIVGDSFFDRVPDVGITDRVDDALSNDGDVIFIKYKVLNPSTSTYSSMLALVQLHDGHLFIAGQPYTIYTR